VSYTLTWESYHITDQFLWPKSSTSIAEMKAFAVSFLAEFLGRDFLKYTAHAVESTFPFIILIIIGFAEQVAYVISKELKIHNSGLAADVIDSKYCNLSTYKQILGLHSVKAPGKEHLIEIFIHLMHGTTIINESLIWDISNPDNSPE
jgi:hypothetical protein